MKDIERYLDHVCGGIRGSPSLRRHLREELREHLLEAVSELTAGGVPEEEATSRAIEEFGTPEMVREGLGAVYGRRLLPLVVEQAMAWKERTMKTGWKWSFVAHAALAAAIAGETLFVWAMVTYILPVTQMELYRATAPEELPLAQFTRSVVHTAAFVQGSLFVWLVPLVLAWVLFEWRFRGEHKPSIRLAAGGLVSLLLLATIWAVSIATVVPLGILPGEIRRADIGADVRREAVEADATMRELHRAADAEDWARVRDLSTDLRHALRSLATRGAAAPVLATLSKEEELDAIRELLEETLERAHAVAGSPPGGESSGVRRHLARLDESYEHLTSRIEGWPRADAGADGGR